MTGTKKSTTMNDQTLREGVNMSEQGELIGVYENLSVNDSHRISDDVIQMIRHKDLLDAGYIPVLNITKDTTEQEIEDGLMVAADIMTPPVEHPMWEALTKSRYLTMDPADRAFMYANDEEEAIILECARKRMENGETEGEAFHNLIMEGVPGVVLVGRAEWEDEVEEEYREPMYSVFAEGDDSLFGTLLKRAGYSKEDRKKIYNGEGTL